MPEFLRDPFWQFAGFVATIVVALIIYLLQRRRKALVYDVESDAPILRAHDQVAGRLEVLLDGEPVQNPRLVVVRLTNSGNLPIRSHDFEERKPILLDFGHSAQVLSARVSDAEPIDVEASVTVQDRVVAIPPLLLNPGDTFRIETVVDGAAKELTVRGRIAGITQIRHPRFPIGRTLRRLVMPVVLLCLIWAYTAVLVTRASLDPIAVIVLALSGFASGLWLNTVVLLLRLTLHQSSRRRH